MGASGVTIMQLYQEINIWVRVREGVVACYRCLQLLPQGTYCVQSKDFFREPFSRERLQQSDKQFIELFSDEAPEIRGETAGSLDEAIKRHEEQFSDAAN